MVPEDVRNDSGHIQQLGRFRLDIRKNASARMIGAADCPEMLVHGDFQEAARKSHVSPDQCWQQSQLKWGVGLNGLLPSFTMNVLYDSINFVFKWQFTRLIQQSSVLQDWIFLMGNTILMQTCSPSYAHLTSKKRRMRTLMDWCNFLFSTTIVSFISLLNLMIY